MNIMSFFAGLRVRKEYLIVITCLLLFSVVVMGFVLSDAFRRTPDAVMVTNDFQASTTEGLVPRYLDGVMVTSTEAKLRTLAVMVENHPDARPWSGLDQASVVFEAPVEGGITRFMALYDSTGTVSEIGPVRSARPYFVDWAAGFKAGYAHVGGSPDALTKIKSFSSTTLFNIDEFAYGSSFWRDQRRYAPHNTYTSISLLTKLLDKKQATTTQAVKAWAFTDEATTTERGDDGLKVSIPYGGSYNVIWKYNKGTNLYTRLRQSSSELTRDKNEVSVNNVIVILTDQKVLDDVGRLELRTVGSGDATLYKNGKTHLIRWKRSPNEPMKFEGRDGAALELNRGKTWISVTTDSRIYAGLGAN